MQVVDHITVCPLLKQERGLAPYPHPVVCFAASVSGTAQVRIYDTSVQPMVELTTTALSGAELSAVTATGLTYAYTLDMGHTTVPSVVDLMNREGFEGGVMFEDSGGTGEKIYVKISANTPEHVRELFPDNAVYLNRSAATSATTFPSGSIFQPVNLIADACTLMTSRKADILDIVGEFSPSTDEPTRTKLGTHLLRKTVRCRPGQVAVLHGEQTLSLDVDLTTFLGSNGNLTLQSKASTSDGEFGGAITVIGCTLERLRTKTGPNTNANGTGAHISKIVDCTIEGAFYGDGNVDELIDCRFNNNAIFDLDYNNYRNIRVIRPRSSFTVGGSKNAGRIDIEDCQGMIEVETGSQITGIPITISGDYKSLTTFGASITATENKSAAKDDLTSNIVNLAAGSITPTEAPNLDVAVSSVSGGGGGGGTDWTSTEKEQIRQRLSLDGTQADPTTAAGDFETLLTNVDATVSSRSSFDATSDTVTISGTLGTLDALDTQQDIQHAATQADITTLLSRIGANDIGVIKGLLLGNYVLDGGSGNVSATYDANGCMTSGRIRVFANSTATAAATKGAANGADSEIARVDLTATAVTGQAYPQNVTGLLT